MPSAEQKLSGSRLRRSADRLSQVSVQEVRKHMDEIICDIQKLLTDIAADVKSGTKADLRRAEKKSARIAALASTLTLMLQMRR